MTAPASDSPVALAANDRVIVLGSSGWFGRTFRDLLPVGIPVMAVAGHPNKGETAWDWEAIRRFRPTLVANFAFLTKSRGSVTTHDAFVATNRLLTQRFLDCVSLSTVRTALTISSGAAIWDASSPYGSLKRTEEERAKRAVGMGCNLVIGRAYSVSGPYVRYPREYAFSDFILQAHEGLIAVTSRQPTWRRYVSVGDFLRVLLLRALAGANETIESGGTLVEMTDLAGRIAGLVNPHAVISLATHDRDEDSVYASDNSTWTSACSLAQVAPLDLTGQIIATAEGLLGTRTDR
jgi:nucleoside-diphosphate-sugar epimerase